MEVLEQQFKTLFGINTIPAELGKFMQRQDYQELKLESSDDIESLWNLIYDCFSTNIKTIFMQSLEKIQNTARKSKESLDTEKLLTADFDIDYFLQELKHETILKCYREFCFSNLEKPITNSTFKNNFYKSYNAAATKLDQSVNGISRKIQTAKPYSDQEQFYIDIYKKTCDARKVIEKMQNSRKPLDGLYYNEPADISEVETFLENILFQIEIANNCCKKDKREKAYKVIEKQLYLKTLLNLNNIPYFTPLERFTENKLKRLFCNCLYYQEDNEKIDNLEKVGKLLHYLKMDELYHVSIFIASHKKLAHMLNVAYHEEQAFQPCADSWIFNIGMNGTNEFEFKRIHSEILNLKNNILQNSVIDFMSIVSALPTVMCANKIINKYDDNESSMIWNQYHIEYLGRVVIPTLFQMFMIALVHKSIGENNKDRSSVIVKALGNYVIDNYNHYEELLNMEQKVIEFAKTDTISKEYLFSLFSGIYYSTNKFEDILLSDTCNLKEEAKDFILNIANKIDRNRIKFHPDNIDYRVLKLMSYPMSPEYLHVMNRKILKDNFN